MWSDIITRRSWLWARSVDKISIVCIKVTKEAVRFDVHHGGVSVRHHDLELVIESFWRKDNSCEVSQV